MDLKTRTVDIRYSVANEGEMFDIMNILDGFLTVNFVEWQPLLRIKVVKVFRNACVCFKTIFLINTGIPEDIWNSLSRRSLGRLKNILAISNRVVG